MHMITNVKCYKNPNIKLIISHNTMLYAILAHLHVHSKSYKILLQKEIKTALLATNYRSMQEWLQAMLSDDTDCDLVGVIGLRMLTNVTI